MSGTRPLLTASYPELLRAAYAMGRVDGLLAADFEPLEGAGPSSAYCRGRDPAALARHLWNVPSGDPPAGLVVNAPLWYAHGFEEALAEVRADRDGSLAQRTPRAMQPSTARPR